MGINREINFAIITGMTVFLIISSVLSFISLKNLEQKEIGSLESTLLQERKNQLSDVVQNAYSVLESADFYETAQKAISGMRFGENGKNHFYVLDADGMIWVNPAQPELVGKSGRELKDGSGNNYLMEIVANALTTTEGFIEFNDHKIPGESLSTKLVHYKLFKEWNWVVCADIYIDDIAGILNHHQAEIHNTMTEQIIQFVILGVLALMLTVVLSMKFFHIRLVAPVHKIINAVEALSMKKFNVDVHVKSNKEINQLADAIERMQESFEIAYTRLRSKAERPDRISHPVEHNKKIRYLKKTG